MQLLFLLALLYALSSFVLLGELDTTKDAAPVKEDFSIRTIVRRCKAGHRRLARLIRRDLTSEFFLNKGVEAACSAEFGCILPRPALLRRGDFAEHELSFAPSELALPLFDAGALLAAESAVQGRRDTEGGSAARGGGEEKAQGGGPTPGSRAARGRDAAAASRSRHAEAKASAIPAAEASPKRDTPYRLSKRVQSEMHDRGRIEGLLKTKVDVVMNQVNLEMHGAIPCGGKPVMEFRDIDAVLGAHPQLMDPGIIPEQDEIGSTGLGSCAVVGNSGSLLHNAHGAEIDGYDTVIRFNGAPTKNFEADVGKKTTIRIQNVDNLGFHEHDDKFLIFSARNKRDLQKFVNHRKRYRKRKQFAFNPEFWCHIWDWVSHRKLKPSTGLAGIVVALKHCQHPVHLYGFHHNDTNFHYFNSLPAKVTTQDVYKFHPLLEEAEIYKELEAEGLATIVS